MLTALTFAILIVGFVLSLWAGRHIGHSINGETAESQIKRQGRTLRNVVVALGCGFTVLVVGAVWLQEAATSSHEATDIALAAARRNCITQQQAHTAAEKGLIADVRLARAQYQASVEAVLQIDERLQAQLPDVGFLPTEVQQFVDAIVEQSRLRNLADRERYAASMERWSTELATREGALDDARARRIESCPSANVADVDIDQVTIPPTTT
jgi:hypothetical protein